MVTFLDDSRSTDLPPHDGLWDIRFSDYVVPPLRTVYACQAFQLNTTGASDLFLVAFRPQLHVSVHHVSVYVCEDTAFWQGMRIPQSCPEFESPSSRYGSGCSSFLYSWGPGMGDLILPSEVRAAQRHRTVLNVGQR